MIKLFSIIILLFMTNNAFSEILTICGKSKGVSKYLDKNPDVELSHLLKME